MWTYRQTDKISEAFGNSEAVAVKAFLRLDPKFRVYGKLDKEEFETQTEVTAYKQRLSRKEERGETVSQEDRRTLRAQAHNVRNPYSSGVVNFSNYKAGDTGCTKTMAQPPELPEREETMVQHQKELTLQAYEEVDAQLKDSKLAYSN